MNWLQFFLFGSGFSTFSANSYGYYSQMNCPYCDHHDPLEIDLHTDGFSTDLLECMECGALLTMKGAILETVQGPAKSFGAPLG